MKTATLSPAQVSRKWYVLDAKDQIMGRLCSTAANLLMGKNKPAYATNLDTGDNVIIINAVQVKLTGNKAEAKTYFSHSTYPGGGKTVTYQEALAKDPAYPITHSIRGMLPKNSRGRNMLKKLHVYAGAEHPHSAQQPENYPLDQLK